MKTNEQITEAQAIAFLKSYAKDILARFPQLTESSVSINIYASRASDGHSTSTVHLIGHGFRECAIESDLTKAVERASYSIETPEKILERARKAAAIAAENLARLEGRTA